MSSANPDLAREIARVQRASLGGDIRTCTEHPPDLRGKTRLRKRLRDQLHARIESAVVNDGVARVAGRIEHLQARPASLRLVCELSTVHAIRKPHVREE